MFLKSVLLLLFYSYIGGAQGYVKLQSSGPTVRGANVTLSAIMTKGYPYGERKFIFRNVQKQETVAVILSSESVVNYTVELSKDNYEEGFYNFQVKVYKRNKHNTKSFSFYDIGPCRIMVTGLLNGNLTLIQNGIDRSHGLVFPNEPVSHNIELSQEELQFLTNDKNTYLVNWYINCSLIATAGLSLNHTYEDAYKTYNLEVLVEVEHDPSFPPISTTRHDRLSSFKCAPIYSSGYTYGYYNVSVRGRATDSSSPPPSRTTENPSNTWQDSRSPDSTIGHWTPRTSETQSWTTTQSSPSTDSEESFWSTSPAPISSSSEYRPVQTSERTTWRSWRTTDDNSWTNWTTTKPRPLSTTSTPTQNTSNTGFQSNCTENAHNTQISVNNGHLKIAIDVLFHGTFNISSL